MCLLFGKLLWCFRGQSGARDPALHLHKILHKAKPWCQIDLTHQKLVQGLKYDLLLTIFTRRIRKDAVVVVLIVYYLCMIQC